MASSSPEQTAVIVRTTTVALPTITTTTTTTTSTSISTTTTSVSSPVSHHQNPFLDLFAFVKEAFSAVLPVRDMPINMNMNMNMNMNISMNSESLHGHHGNHGDRSCLDILKRLLGGAGGGATELRIAALPVRVLKGAEDTDKLEYDQNCCSICLDGYEHNNRVRILGCGHCYHVQCVDKWLMKRNACPMCSRVVC